MPRQTLIQIRRGSESELVEANPTLSLGEMTYITDSNKLAIGNGALLLGKNFFLGSE